MKQIAITGGRGYVGSALVEHLSRRADLEIYSIDTRPIVLRERFAAQLPYQDLTYQQSDVIIHLAAHSSVKACQADPAGAWANNVTGFAQLLTKLRPDQTLIYASTAGVYDRASGPSRESDRLPPPSQLYDLTKRTMDDLARLSGLDCYGLRFGTLAGPSPTMRHDPVVNAMVRSAVETGVIRVQNPQAARAVLAMADCVRAIERIIDAPAAPGIYNIASFNTTIWDIAATVALLTGAQVALEADTPHYDFAIDTTKSRRVFGIEYRATLESVCAALMEAVPV